VPNFKGPKSVLNQYLHKKTCHLKTKAPNLIPFPKSNNISGSNMNPNWPQNGPGPNAIVTFWLVRLFRWRWYFSTIARWSYVVKYHVTVKLVIEVAKVTRVSKGTISNRSCVRFRDEGGRVLDVRTRPDQWMLVQVKARVRHQDGCNEPTNLIRRFGFFERRLGP